MFVNDHLGTAYATSGRVTSSGVLVSEAQTTFESDGCVAVTMNAFRLEPHTLYGWRGRVTETRREAIDETGSTVWLVSRTMCDSRGRLELMAQSGRSVEAFQTMRQAKFRRNGGALVPVCFACAEQIQTDTWIHSEADCLRV
jgi:hypothetical protein